MLYLFTVCEVRQIYRLIETSACSYFGSAIYNNLEVQPDTLKVSSILVRISDEGLISEASWYPKLSWYSKTVTLKHTKKGCAGYTAFFKSGIRPNIRLNCWTNNANFESANFFLEPLQYLQNLSEIANRNVDRFFFVV